MIIYTIITIIGLVFRENNIINGCGNGKRMLIKESNEVNISSLDEDDIEILKNISDNMKKYNRLEYLKNSKISIVNKLKLLDNNYVYPGKIIDEKLRKEFDEFM